tara:strand:- start:91 stop:336 length:246 start_codon:yes stop_codon:yes gene_type:complete
MNKLLQEILDKILYNYNLKNDFFSNYMKTLFIKKFETKSIYYMTHYINIMIYQQLLEECSLANLQIPKYVNYENMREIQKE